MLFAKYLHLLQKEHFLINNKANAHLQIIVHHVLKFKLQVHIISSVWNPKIGTSIENLANTLVLNMGKEFTRMLMMLKHRCSHQRTWQDKPAAFGFSKQKRNWNWRDLFLKMTTGYRVHEHQKKKPSALKKADFKIKHKENVVLLTCKTSYL